MKAVFNQNEISKLLAVCLFFSVFLSFCKQQKSEDKVLSSISFTPMPASKTGVTFSNPITEGDSVNLIYNAYTYMGSGVGIGDFNNDGLPDIFFGANQASSKMYINKGNFQFEDITAAAGISTNTWITGVNVIDINQDGFDDIYLCASIYGDPAKRKNLLFINDGKLHFTEMAAAYGLNDSSYSSQAAFFDYDRDGDLDMYLLNHYIDHHNSNNIVKRNLSGNSPAQDRLYRNNGIDSKKGHYTFEDVSKSAGIAEDGYGLGIAVTDINGDGWPDLYVANDYLPNDILWVNNKNGGFTNVISRALKHQSYSSMGVEASDLNNDGLPDIVSLDMMPEDNYRHKMMYTFVNFDRYTLERRAGYEPEFMRNMLQLNNGLRSMNDTVLPFFSEVGQLAGISETDWSWSVLAADLNNDGTKDLHITNGMGRDMINSDFITYYAASVQHPVSDFKTFYKNILKKLDEYGTIELNNYCYQNNGGLNFTDVSKSAGLGGKSISNGCAYADLDNDGDLDLVVNNINKEAFVLKNEARQSATDTSNNFLSVHLKGEKGNTAAIGARVELYVQGSMQLLEQNPVRGYLSTVDKRLHFGTGMHKTIDSLKIYWPNGKLQVLRLLKANSIVESNIADAIDADQVELTTAGRLFNDISGRRGLAFKHTEQPFYDYGFQPLLPQKYSQLGPFISQGDVNGDGLTDFFVGGATGQSGKLFLQQADGNFASRDLESGKMQEDLGSLFFDADGDKDLDLLINSGGNEYDAQSPYYLPRLFKNDGQGNFALDKSALPQTIFTSAQCVAGGDYDGDGDVDIFIGGRVSPGRYPVVPTSYLLRNDGGTFSVVTPEVCPELENAGMITSALWTDIDGDKKPELIVAGEWMAVRIFKYSGTNFKEISAASLPAGMSGQWRSLQAADLDGDGDLDLVAGNIGANNHYKASDTFPIKLFAKDFDGNGSMDPVIAYYRNDDKGNKVLYPGINREQFAAQVPLVKKKFLYNKDYAVSDMNAVLKGAEMKDILEFTCNETRTVWLENLGGAKFKIHYLPLEAQFAPVNSIVCTDADNDGKMDIILAGNEYQAEVMTGQYDASYGLFLKGVGKGNFKAIKPVDSRLIIDGDVKDLKILITAKNEHIILAAVNDGNIKAFRYR